MKNSVETNALAIGYGKAALARDIALGAAKGQVLALIGPNGAGKSTLLKTLAGQLTPLGGAVLLDGQELARIPGNARAQKLALMLPHTRRTELTTCFEFAAAGRIPYTGRLGILSAEDKKQVQNALELVGAAHLADRDFNCVSDGQRQRILLARAVCQQPQVLLLDEPTSFLDIRGKIELLTILQKLAHEQQLAVIVTLHELDMAQKIADAVVCVSPHGVSAPMPPAQAFARENIKALYGLTEEQYSAVFDPSRPEKPQFEHYVRSGQKLLRCGYTTGTCAALAAAGAARLLLTGIAPETVALRTPKGIVVEVAPLFCRAAAEGAECAIEKDGGDDVDVTTGLPVIASVALRPELSGEVRIHGGEGVGRVTKPGLDQPVGEAAINHVPRAMIKEALEKEAESAGYAGGFDVTISIEGGAETAKRTFNPHMGVEGGLSVLGTSGIVEPMSQQAILGGAPGGQPPAAHPCPGQLRPRLSPREDARPKEYPGGQDLELHRGYDGYGGGIPLRRGGAGGPHRQAGQTGGRGHEHPFPHGGWPCRGVLCPCGAVRGPARSVRCPDGCRHHGCLP